ncbi:hypothetical protein THAOC_28653 [Thalassiosira oceanica]|uniref:Uncharacterized protein n=1 Tax=Thalassiosira oceanica TaxID=159749 RepID=K0REH7_THAOC|nr:hypothetical protein THAOC_28653 [Thalassiosira oceanica]|eukprot:EJK52113.1 hypothetical protein THAOC_28653 [Thalassiosira oceanica]
MSRLVSFAKTPLSFMSRLLTPSKSSSDGTERPQVPRTPPSGTSEPALGASQLSSAKRTFYSAKPSTEWVSSQHTKHGIECRTKFLAKFDEVTYQLTEDDHDEFVEKFKDIFEDEGLEDVFFVPRDGSGRRTGPGREDSSPASILDEYKTSGGVTLEHVQEQVALQTRTGLLDTPATSKDKYQIRIDETEITLDNATDGKDRQEPLPRVAPGRRALFSIRTLEDKEAHQVRAILRQGRRGRDGQGGFDGLTTSMPGPRRDASAGARSRRQAHVRLQRLHDQERRQGEPGPTSRRAPGQGRASQQGGEQDQA